MLLVPAELRGKSLQLGFEFPRGVGGRGGVGVPDTVQERAEGFGDGAVHAEGIVRVEFILVDSGCKLHEYKISMTDDRL